jgi:exopolyphosphatase / guanosine-5'-triphosphate,3'-diphosphate pyrophosphatase
VKRVAAIDIGSNSVRCLVAEVPANGPYRLLTEDRAQTRLASGLASTGMLQEQPMDETAEALARMVDLAAQFRADTVRAVATAAVRDAANGPAFVDRVEELTGVRIEVISEREEARLAFVGALANFEVDGRFVVLDVGGGSLEVIRAAGSAVESDRSLPLGAVVLTERFVTRDPLTDRSYKRMRRWVRQMLATEFGENPDQVPVVIGSGGSVTALAAMAARVERWSYLTVHGAELTEAQVVQTLSGLRRMPVEQRRLVPRPPQHPADIIVAGSLVVAEVMRLFGANTLKVNAKGLREALLLDTIQKATARKPRSADRMRGVLEFARRTRYEKEHALHVAVLALSLFDQLADPLGLDVRDRQLLEAAAVLHDVGYFIDYERHHKHSYHLITHASLPGFSPRDVQMIASTARYHRGAMPERKHEAMRRLTPEDRVRMERLAAILRLADGLDRSRTQAVRAVRVEAVEDSVLIALDGSSSLDVEVYGSRTKGTLFEKVFGLGLRVTQPGTETESVSDTQEP